MKTQRMVVLLLALSLILVGVQTANASRLLGMAGGPASVYPNCYTTSINSFLQLSQQHDSSWGLFHVQGDPITYEDAAWYVRRGDEAAYEDDTFPATYNSLETPVRLMVAHLRKATTGSPGAPGPHPFLYDLFGGVTAFAHNGTLNDSLHYWWPTMRSAIGDFWYLDVMQRAYRGTSETDTTSIDSELYGMLLNKYYMIAKNYDLPTSWAIIKTLEQMNQNYTFKDSHNMLFTDLDSLYALEQHTGNHGQYYDIHYRILDDASDIWNTISVGSNDVALNGTGATTTLGNNRLLRIARNGEDYTIDYDVHTNYGNLDDPEELFANSVTLGAQENASVERCDMDQSFAAVWEDQGGVTMRWFNELGLAEHPSLHFDGSIHLLTKPDVAFGPYNIATGYHDIYVTFLGEETVIPPQPADRIYLVHCWFDTTSGKWTSNFNEYVTAPGLDTSMPKDNPRIATNSYDNLMLVWDQEDAGGYRQVKGKGWHASGSTGVTTIYRTKSGIPYGCETYRPDVAYVADDDGNGCFAISYVYNYLTPISVTASVKLTTWKPFSQTYPSYVWDVHGISPSSLDVIYPKLGANYLDEYLRVVTLVFQDNTSAYIANLKSYQFYYSYLGGNSSGLTYLSDTDYNVNLAPSTYNFHPSVAGRSLFNYDMVFNTYEGVSYYRKIILRSYVNGTPTNQVLSDVRHATIQARNAPVVASSPAMNFPERRFVLWSAYGEDGSSWGINGYVDPDIMSYTVPKRGFAQMEEEPLPTVHRLLPSYPNPFNATTTLRFELPDVSDVHLTVYSVTGREMVTMTQHQLHAGQHEVALNASDWSSGVYFIRFRSEGVVQTQKIVLIK